MIDLIKHAMALLLGFGIAALLILEFGNTIDPDITSQFATVVIFVPFLFAFASFDRHHEGWQTFVLKFATSTMFGIYAALLAFNPNSGNGILKWGLFLLAYSMCLAVWTSGHQSRGFRGDVVGQYGSFPSYTRRLLGLLIGQQRQTLVNDLTLALLDWRYQEILDRWEEIETIVLKEARGRKHREALQFLLERAKSEIENWPDEVDSPVSVVSLPSGAEPSNLVQLSG